MTMPASAGDSVISKAPEAMVLVETAKDARKLELENGEQLAYLTQTTLSLDDTADVVDALRDRFPDLVGPPSADICYATQNRQDAVKQLLADSDVLVVVGSKSSSNSNRLRELADRAGVPGYLVDGADDLQQQ